MIGLRMVNDIVMMNCTPTMAHMVRCQSGGTLSCMCCARPARWFSMAARIGGGGWVVKRRGEKLRRFYGPFGTGGGSGVAMIGALTGGTGGFAGSAAAAATGTV